MKAQTLQTILERLESKRPVVLATDLQSGEQRLLSRGDGVGSAERATVESALRLDRCVNVASDAKTERAVFYQPFNPPLRLVLIGAVHIAQPLATMAALSGYEVTIVDPRESFGSQERFPGVSMNVLWPDAALEELSLDARSAVVTLTHDPKLDDPALRVALRSEAFFIGCLGNNETHAARSRRLEKAGFTKQDLERAQGLVGLPVDSRSPAEIAVSILARMTQTLREPHDAAVES